MPAATPPIVASSCGASRWTFTRILALFEPSLPGHAASREVSGVTICQNALAEALVGAQTFSVGGA